MSLVNNLFKMEREINREIEFQTGFLHILEIRALLPHKTNVMSLTATATIKTYNHQSQYKRLQFDHSN